MCQSDASKGTLLVTALEVRHGELSAFMLSHDNRALMVAERLHATWCLPTCTAVQHPTANML